MDLITVHKEVIKFLEESDAVFIMEDGKKAFYTNDVLHIESDTPGVYIRQFVNIEIKENDIS